MTMHVYPKNTLSAHQALLLSSLPVVKVEVAVLESTLIPLTNQPSPLSSSGVNSNQPTGGAASYNRFAGTSNTANKPTNYNKYLGVSNKPPASQSYNKYGGSYLNKGAAPKPPVVVNTWNDRQHNGYK